MFILSERAVITVRTLVLVSTGSRLTVTVALLLPPAQLLLAERVTALIERKEEVEVGTYSTAHPPLSL